MINKWRTLALPAVLVLGLAACEGGLEQVQEGTQAEETDGGQEKEGEDGVASLEVTTVDYGFEMPDEIDGGVVEVTATNEGDVTHEVAFMQVPEGYDVDQFPEDMTPVLEGGPFPEEFQSVAGVPDIESGDSLTSTVTLPEGTYVAFCTLTDEVAEPEGPAPEEEGISSTDEATQGEQGEDDANAGEGGGEGGGDDEEPPPHYELGMTKLVTATGGADATGADIAGTDGTLEAFDYGFQTEELAELGKGDHTLAFHNTSGEQFHHAIVMEFPEDVDEQGAREAFDAFAEAGEGPPPEGVPEPEEVGYTSVFGPGLGGTFDVALKSGRTYAVVCFIQDREGGPPHAFAHDMVEFFTVE